LEEASNKADTRLTRKRPSAKKYSSLVHKLKADTRPKPAAPLNACSDTECLKAATQHTARDISIYQLFYKLKQLHPAGIKK